MRPNPTIPNCIVLLLSSAGYREGVPALAFVATRMTKDFFEPRPAERPAPPSNCSLNELAALVSGGQPIPGSLPAPARPSPLRTYIFVPAPAVQRNRRK